MRTALLITLGFLLIGGYSYVSAVDKVTVESKLVGKNRSERANIKADEIAKLDSTGEFIKSDLKVEIQSVTKIDGGVEVFARAWRGGEQLGFGEDGTVEIERFRIFNPPILVEDPLGDIVRDSFDDIEKKNFRTILREDPEEALRQSLTHTISVVGKNGSNIIEGKRGNTTTTFYPAAGAASPVDGFVMRDTAVAGESWATTRAGTGNSTDTSSATEKAALIYDGDCLLNWCAIARSVFGFDTSTITDTDSIVSATLSFYGSTKIDGYTGASVVVDRNPPASDSALANGDFDIGGWDGVEQSTARITIASFSTTAYNDFTLNATGISNVSKTGISWFGLRHSMDFDNAEPTKLNANSVVRIHFADETGTANDPALIVVTTGTVGGGMMLGASI